MILRNNRMKKKITILFILIIIVAILIFLFPYIFLRFDFDGDGNTDLVWYTNGISTIKLKDFDSDGNFDIKEYNYLFSYQIKYFLVLNDSFDNLTINQHYSDGQICSIKMGERCPKRKVKVKKTIWKIGSKTIFAAGRN